MRSFTAELDASAGGLTLRSHDRVLKESDPIFDARALVVADDPLVRDALCARLGAAAIGDAATQDDLVDAIARAHANAVLWDLGPVGAIDPELAARVEAMAVPVVALAGGSARNDLLAPAFAAGLSGVLARDTPAAALQLAMGSAVHGLFVLDRSFAPEPGLAEIDVPPRSTDGESLTARELEVVQLMAEGLANKQIADRLGISTHTAKFHVNAVLGKLGASTRTEAVVKALQRGLVML